MKDFRSLEHKIRNIVSETVARNTEQRMKIKNVGRPEDTDRSKLAKQAEIKTKIIDEESVKEVKIDEASAAQQRTAAAALATQRGEYDAGKKGGAINRMSAMKPEDLKKIMKNAKHKVKEDDQSDDPIARINNVTNNLKQMTNEPKPAPSLPNVNDIPSSNPASKLFKIKEAASDSFDNSDEKKKEPKKDSKKDDGDDPKKITGGKTDVDLQPTTNDSPEMNDTEDKSSNKAKNKANKEIGAKGVKEQVMTEKNFGLPESLIQAVTEVLKGKQKNLDKNHNGKLDKQDFKMIRKEEAVDEGNFANKIKKNQTAKKIGVDAARKGDERFSTEMQPHVAAKMLGRQIQKEDVEPIDELSKDTLQKYIRKAASDAASHAYTAGAGSSGRMNINRDEFHAKASSRLQGISKAAQKLAKEEVESIDELKKTTLGSYIKKASDSATMHAYGAGGESQRHAGEPVSKRPDTYGADRKVALKRLKGINRATDRLTKEEVELDEAFDKNSKAHQAAKKTVKGMERLARAEFHPNGSASVHTKGNEHVSSTRVVDHHHDIHGLGYNRPESAYKKSSFKKDGLTHRTQSVHGGHTIHIHEEVEQVDELSKATLGSYVNKSAASLGKAGYNAGSTDGTAAKLDPHIHTINKRSAGIKRAVGKLAKEEVEELDELKKSTMKSYVKKAEKSQDKAYDDSEHHMQKAINARKYENMIKHSKASEKAEKTFAKRTDGMERANMKLRYGRYRTEEVEFSDAELAHIETIMNSDNGVK